MNSNEGKLYTKVIVLSTIYNFVVEKFFLFEVIQYYNI